MGLKRKESVLALVEADLATLCFQRVRTEKHAPEIGNHCSYVRADFNSSFACSLIRPRCDQFSGSATIPNPGIYAISDMRMLLSRPIRIELPYPLDSLSCLAHSDFITDINGARPHEHYTI